MSDETGFDVVPARYGGDREAIDLIRDSMSDTEFAAYCRATAMKYRHRLGKKGPDDAEKARWYDEMEAHVLRGGADPRHVRPGFTPYERRGVPAPTLHPEVPVLDHGYVRLIETWGAGDARLPEAGIIEAARQSTQGSFRGWEQDRKLLSYLHNNKHGTPFEFAGMVIEVQAPIFVFREWHRHRTQSYNEMSARYAPIPDVSYVPTTGRLLMQGAKQGGSVGEAQLDAEGAEAFQRSVVAQYQSADALYRDALARGVPKELARVIMPVGRYSRMRASANLRNWLAFLTLRLDPAAQWEIRQYAEVVRSIVGEQFPQVAALLAPGR